MAAQHQHYVPQLLLRGFLSREADKAAKEQVHVLDLEEEKIFTPSVSNIMGERRFNDFWIDEENLATIEPAAGRIEDYVTPLVKRIREERRLERTPEEFADLSLLMAFQFVRTKKMRLLPERLNQFMRTQVEKMGFDPAKTEGLEEWDEEKLKRAHVRQQVGSLQEYATIIAEKEFFLMTAPEGSSFYLGDHPVVLHNDEEPRGMMGRLGIGVPYIQIYLPLSADVMLCAYDKAILGQLMKSYDAQIKEIQAEAFGMLREGMITALQMKQALDGLKDLDITTPLIKSIRAGEPVPISQENVQHYNSLQAFQAHRFVVDPDGKFEVAKAMIPERKSAEGI